MLVCFLLSLRVTRKRFQPKSSLIKMLLAMEPNTSKN